MLHIIRQQVSREYGRTHCPGLRGRSHGEHIPLPDAVGTEGPMRQPLEATKLLTMYDGTTSDLELNDMTG